MFKPRNLQEENWAKASLPKSKLEHGAYYRGSCRNASIARWNAGTERFVYIREKFGFIYPEDIRHFEDDDGFDVYFPVEKVDPPAEEIPLEV